MTCLKQQKQQWLQAVQLLLQVLVLFAWQQWPALLGLCWLLLSQHHLASASACLQMAAEPLPRPVLPICMLQWQAGAVWRLPCHCRRA
jgi:hypothetical protein